MVLHSSFGLTRSMLLLLLMVLQRKRGVEGLLLLALEVGCCLSASAVAAAAAAVDSLLSLGTVLQNALLQPVPIFLQYRINLRERKRVVMREKQI